MTCDHQGDEETPAYQGGVSDPALMAAVAQRYYLHAESKVAIGKETGLSRFQVARLLREAVDRGVVKITITAEGMIDKALGIRVQEYLGVPRAIVVSVPNQTSEIVLRHLGKTLADLLGEEVSEGETLGLAWSRVDGSMVDQIAHLERCTVVQLAGHLLIEGETSSSIEAVRRTAAVGGGEAYPIYAPMIVDDAATATVLRRSPEVATALAHADRLDRAVVSIGAWGSPRSRVYRRLSLEDQRRGLDNGAVGEICGRVFNADGELLNDLIDDRVIAVTLDQLRKVPQVIGTSWGAETARAVETAARAGWIHTLLIDEPLARSLLASSTHA